MIVLSLSLYNPFCHRIFPRYLPCLCQISSQNHYINHTIRAWKENPSFPLSGTTTLTLIACLCSGTSIVSRKRGDLPESNSANSRSEWPSSSAFYSLFNTEVSWATERPTRTYVFYVCHQCSCVDSLAVDRLLCPIRVSQPSHRNSRLWRAVFGTSMLEWKILQPGLSLLATHTELSTFFGFLHWAIILNNSTVCRPEMLWFISACSSGACINVSSSAFFLNGSYILSYQLSWDSYSFFLIVISSLSYPS